MFVHRAITAISRLSPIQIQARTLHVCAPLMKMKMYTPPWMEGPNDPRDKDKIDYRSLMAPTVWVKQNDIVYEPQKPGQPPEPAWVCHERRQIRYSPKKMYHVAILIRGLSIDEALKQLRFCRDKGAVVVEEILLEAQEMAVREHNVEFKSNLWVAESITSKDLVIKGLRRHARGRFGMVQYKYCKYQVRLEEGTPPEDYYGDKVTATQSLEKWIQKRREREIEQGV